MDFVIENNIITRCTNKGLWELKIPDGVVAIDKYAFQNCLDLRSVELPKTLKKIGDYAFDGCNDLETVHHSNKLISVIKYVICQMVLFSVV